MKDTTERFIAQLNAWGVSRTPFVFVIDYQMQKPLAWQLEEIDAQRVRFDFNGFTNQSDQRKADVKDHLFEKKPLPFDVYQARFAHVIAQLKAGNSFLVNLSMPTAIQTDLTLLDIFQRSEAPYRFLMDNDFVCFSPEIFVRISGNRIASYPMKGTIDAAIPDAENVILNNHKEAAEHATIVDLIRNDLSMVCKKVWVERYRYIDKIQASDKCLLQVSSEIAGILDEKNERMLGDILFKLLPAGSITGAPKPSTMRIISEAEQYERGYYTGVMGYYDGENLESAVMIRFIEKQGENLVFKSGGGITALSAAESEYQELVDKVYLPFSYAPQSVL